MVCVQSDGSMVLWDLREVPSMHQYCPGAGTEERLRRPTYSTAGVLQYDNHQGAVVAVQPIVASSDR